MNELKAVVEISRYAGERFDLIQAGGGNTSVKFDDGMMLIKASGFLLSNVSETSGFVKVSNDRVKRITKSVKSKELKTKNDREELAAKLLNEVVIDNNARPSIETYLHSLLNKYTLHTHPIVVNAITCLSNWNEILKSIFPKALLINYCTPGIELAIEMESEIETYFEKFKEIPKVVFLQNHGLIISSDDFDEVISLNEEVLEVIEKYLNVDLIRYKLTTKISHLVNAVHPEYKFVYLSSDETIKRILLENRWIFHQTPLCPDTFVFCGAKVLEISNLQEKNVITEFITDYMDLPKVILYENNIFFIAENSKKAKEVEDVFKSHIMTLEMCNSEKINYLPSEELSYLGKWEAEKYRQKL